MSTTQLTCPHCRTVIQEHIYPYTTTVMCNKCGKYFGRDQGQTLVSTAIFDKMKSPSNVPSQNPGVAYPLVSPAYIPSQSVSYPSVQSMTSSIHSHPPLSVTPSSSTPSMSNFSSSNSQTYSSSSQYPLLNSQPPLKSASSMYNYASSLPKNSPAFIAHSSAPPSDVQYNYLSGVNVIPSQNPSVLPSNAPQQLSASALSHYSNSTPYSPQHPPNQQPTVPLTSQYPTSSLPATNLTNGNTPFVPPYVPPPVLQEGIGQLPVDTFVLPSAPPLSASAEIEIESVAPNPPIQKSQQSSHVNAIPEHLLHPHPTFICPITQDVMDHPVVATDGFTYEKSAIEMWFQNHRTSPMTNQALPSKQLIPNLNLRSQIIEWKEQRQKHHLT